MPSSGEVALRAEADVGGSGDDDVIEEFNLEELADSDEIPSHADVCFGWCGVQAQNS